MNSKPASLVAASVLVLCHANSLVAQTTAPNKDVLEARLSAQEHRADLLHEEILSIDKRIEGRVDEIINILRMVGDSKDSRTKVSRMKEATIDRLQKGIVYYQQKRAWLEEQMIRPTFNLTPMEKQRIISGFDDRIEKRVKQILALYKSMPTHKDYERYTASGDSWYGGTYMESEDFKQNERLATHTNAQRDKIIKELRSSAERLEAENRTLAQRALTAPSEELRLVYKDEERKNTVLIEARRTHLSEIFTLPATPTRPISGSEARAIDDTMQHSIDSLRREFTTLFERYTVWLGERSSVNSLKTALDNLPKSSQPSS